MANMVELAKKLYMIVSPELSVDWAQLHFGAFFA